MKNILSIDGGGIYGFVPLAVCIEIEKELNRRGFATRDGNPAELSDVFDIFYCTSTGAIIIGVALAGINEDGAPRVRGFNAQKVKDLYSTLGPIIFGEQTGAISIGGIPINGPKFDGVELENSLALLGRRPLSRFSIPNLNAQNKPLDVAISAFNLSTGKPQFFRSWINGAANGDIDVIDAILASSFAPLFFPLKEINRQFYSDGGIFAVNPALFALTDTLKRFPGETINVVSLGTGEFPGAFEPATEADVDVFFWASRVSRIIQDGQISSSDEQLQTIAAGLPNVNYFRFDVILDQPKRSDETDPVILNSAANKMTAEISTSRGTQRAEFERMINSIINT
ncbi:MAG: patatin-like phospholipase family protein [Cyanobacteria bacterium P01_F01_bin.143]